MRPKFCNSNKFPGDANVDPWTSVSWKELENPNNARPLQHGSESLKKLKMWNLLFYLFIYLLNLFLAALGLHCCAWAFSSCGERGLLLLRCTGFSSPWLLLLWSTGSRRAGFSSCGSRALKHSLSSCGTGAQLLHSMWDLPGPGIEPVSPALAGGFLTAAPPGKSQDVQLKTMYIFHKGKQY